MTEMPFAGGGLDRADHIRDQPGIISGLLANPSTRILCFRDLDVAMQREPVDLAWRSATELPATKDERPTVLLGLDDNGTGHFAVQLGEADHEWSSAMFEGFVDARSAGLQLPDQRAALVAFARSMLSWRQRHRYCPVCGHRNQVRNAGMQLVCGNPDCATVHFPRTDPVVIMLVETPARDACLLGRSAHYPAGLASALAGFVEPGESIEDAVKREIMEEAGIVCGDCRYFASQPWPFPSSLMIGCFATAITTEITIDERELEWARWFSRAEVAELFEGRIAGLTAPQPVAIAHHLLRHWLAHPAGAGAR